MNCQPCLPHFCAAWTVLRDICPDQATPELMERSARLGSLLPYRKAAEVMAPDIDDATLKALRETFTSGRLSFADAQERTIELPVSFRGFSQAFNALSKSEAVK